ncbi:MAG TPA: cytochrome c biogenesis protein CcdC [Longimicrobiales bacterium]|nr:cytochrome c biogenesis protein CcdC [Longimicrobiales bacterium]
MIAPLRLLTALAPIAGGVAVLAWRIQETRKPVTVGKIVLPPLAMSTGFAMFVSPMMRIPWAWGVGAFLLGAFALAVPLARSSSLERVGDVIVMRRSHGFLVILLGLLALRLAAHDYIGHVLPAGRTAALFFVLAYGMIARWRLGMYLRFRAL